MMISNVILILGLVFVYSTYGSPIKSPLNKDKDIFDRKLDQLTTELDQDQAYIDSLIQKYFLIRVPVEDITQKLQNMQAHELVINELVKEASEPTQKQLLDDYLSRLDFLFQIGKILENFVILINDASLNTQDYETILKDVENRLLVLEAYRHPYSDFETYHRFIQIWFLSFRMNLDNKKVLDLIPGSIAKMPLDNKNDVHEVVMAAEKHFEELKNFEDQSENAMKVKMGAFKQVEYLRLEDKFLWFFELVKEENLDLPITPEQLQQLGQQVDAINQHLDNIQNYNQAVQHSGQLMAAFSELLFEALSLKLDASRSPLRALYLIEELKKSTEIPAPMLNLVPIEVRKTQKEISEMLDQAADDALNRRKDYYKSILKALLKLKVVF